jgi:hypothetical protein
MKFNLEGLSVEDLCTLMSECVEKITDKKEQKRQYLFNKLCQVLDEIEAEGFKTYDPQGEIIDSQTVEVASPEE